MSQAYISVALLRLVTERAQRQCEYCRCLSDYHSDPFAIEHIVPEAKGGATEESNLALSCMGCNGYKGAFMTGRDPATGLDAPLFHPRLQRWTEHFAWSDGATQVIGLTAMGRATVTRLCLNRFGLLNLRTVLRNSGIHPPPEPL